MAGHAVHSVAVGATLFAVSGAFDLRKPAESIVVVATSDSTPAYSERDSAMWYASRGEYPQAIVIFDQLLQRGDTATDVHYWHAFAHWKLNHADTALAGMRFVIARQPDHFDANLIVDRVLSGQGRWAEILPYWDAYITPNPDSAKAYLERGGTKFKMSRRAEAITDAAKACELGLQQACSVVQRLR